MLKARRVAMLCLPQILYEWLQISGAINLSLHGPGNVSMVSSEGLMVDCFLYAPCLVCCELSLTRWRPTLGRKRSLRGEREKDGI